MTYSDYIRTLPCLICGKDDADPHHLKTVGTGRQRELSKWEDYTLIPLNRQYHQELHQIGLTKFEDKYKIDLFKEALFILAKWSHNERNKVSRVG